VRRDGMWAADRIAVASSFVDGMLVLAVVSAVE
jgi:hypothetical protein